MKLHGYDFWEQVLKSPKYILAPMVDQSELPWRILSRRYGAQVTYTPMYNSAVFLIDETYRNKLFQTDDSDRPLVVQFCGNDPQTVLKAALMVENCCDAIDLNLGCPQNVAKRGKYGAFLDDWDVIFKIVRSLHDNLKSIPVTAKFRVFDCVEKTCKYAQMLEEAGAAVLTVHGRTREQKGPMSGLADWEKIAAIKKCVKVPVVANGNILCFKDIERCLRETKVDAVMSAEGNLHNPALFAPNCKLKVTDAISEYLELCHTFPTSMSFIRAHIFKMCYHILQFEKFLFLREIITEMKTLEDVEKLNETLKRALSENEEFVLEMTGDMQLSIMYCQARVRSSGESKDNYPKIRTNQFSREDRKRTLAQIQSEHGGCSLRQAKQLMRNPEKGFQKSNRPWLHCMCRQPKSKGCAHEMCKICCRKLCLEKKVGCEQHKMRKIEATRSEPSEIKLG